MLVEFYGGSRSYEGFFTYSSVTYSLDLRSNEKNIVGFFATCFAALRPPDPPTLKEWYDTGIYKTRISESEQAVGISSNSESYDPFFLKDAKILVVLATGDTKTMGHTQDQTSRQEGTRSTDMSMETVKMI